MKKRQWLARGFALFCAMMFVAAPAAAIAEEALPDPILVSASPVIITEIQTGGATASDEFVELYNTSDAPVDITGWQVRYLNASGAGDATVLVATVAAPDNTPVVLAGQAYYVLHSSTVALPEAVAGQVYTASLSKTDKTVALFGRDTAACQMTVRDAVAWEAAPGTTMGEGTAVLVEGGQASEDKVLQRRMSADGLYQDTNSNAQDFALLASTPGADNIWPTPSNAQSGPSLLPTFAASNCTTAPQPPVPADPPEDPTVPEVPPVNEGLAPPQLSELLANPGAPKTDANDEYVELYNPNLDSFDLGGYTLEAGVTTKYRYTFPEGTVLEGQAYRAFMSSDTHIPLSNASGQARLIDPGGVVVAQSEAYTAAADDKAWALVDATWQWTTILTPNAANEVTPPATPEGPVTPPTPEPNNPPPAPSPNAGLLAPQLTELLPNPAAPKTDADDEFIELYNPNDAPYALGGYVLEAGLTTKYRYTIPAGTTLQPHAYLAFFSADTSIAMSNTSGQARLMDPAGVVIVQSDAYTTAKDDYAWTFTNGTWQWSTTPTPNAANVLSLALAPVAKKTATAKTSKKSTKAATTKKTTKSAKKTPVVAGNAAQAAVATSTPRDPLHPATLAAIGGFALLYGAYEYRRDVANKLYQFRSNRAARRELRQSTKGR